MRILNILCTLGLRRSASINKTLESALAIVSARLTAVVVLPSPAIELVTRIRLGGASAEASINVVRSALKLSEYSERGSVLTIIAIASDFL